MAIIIHFILALAPAASEFEAWLAAHPRHYASNASEARLRESYFARNVRDIRAMAEANPYASFEPGEEADASPEELDRMFGGGDFVRDYEEQELFSEGSVRAAVAAGDVDWVQRGAVNEPVSQGRCATCASFSAVADIEAQWFLAGNPLTKLSEQELIDCASYTGPYGMGWVSKVHKGIATSRDYPLANHSDPTLAGCRSHCNTTRAAKLDAFISGATCLPEQHHDNETQMLAWLEHGPLSVSIAGGPLNGYRGGVITKCDNRRINHAVLIVGRGTDPDSGLPYWKLRNSWGPHFGEGGYFRIQRGVSCLGIRGACQAYIGAPPRATDTRGTSRRYRIEDKRA